jgi:hypothetical protein
VLITALQLLVQRVCLPLIWVEAYGPPILSVALRNRHGDRRDRRRHRRRRTGGGGHGHSRDRCADGHRRGRRLDRHRRQGDVRHAERCRRG